jgi:hypothetical protein
VAAAAGLDGASVRVVTGDNSVRWSELAASHWKEWVAFCLAVRRSRLRDMGNFGANRSLFHPTPYSPVDHARLAQLKQAAQRQLGVQYITFDRRYECALRAVARYERQGRLDVVFNGKWFRDFLLVAAEQAARGRDFHRAGFGDRIFECLALTVDYAAGWADRYRVAFQQFGI